MNDTFYNAGKTAKISTTDGGFVVTVTPDEGPGVYTSDALPTFEAATKRAKELIGWVDYTETEMLNHYRRVRR